MTEQQLHQRLTGLFFSEIRRLSPYMVEQISPGSYRLFDRYTVNRTDSGHSVSRSSTLIVPQFHSLKSAVSWCVADQNNRNDLAQQIINFDHLVANLTQNISNYERVRRTTTDKERKHILLTKAEDCRIRLESAKNELDKCIDLAKYIQTRGFTNEAPRTGRPASFKTSR